MALCLGEVSNPFNIMRKNFALLGKEKVALVTSIIFVVVYIIARGMFIPVLAYEIQYSEITIWFKLICGLLLFVSLVWLFLIFNLASKQLSEVRIGLIFIEAQ